MSPAPGERITSKNVTLENCDREQIQFSNAVSLDLTTVPQGSQNAAELDMSYNPGAAGFQLLNLGKFETMIQQVADYWFSCVRLPENAKRVI